MKLCRANLINFRACIVFLFLLSDSIEDDEWRCNDRTALGRNVQRHGDEEFSTIGECFSFLTYLFVFLPSLFITP